jgi:hypothetical protein
VHVTPAGMPVMILLLPQLPGMDLSRGVAAAVEGGWDSDVSMLLAQQQCACLPASSTFVQLLAPLVIVCCLCTMCCARHLAGPLVLACKLDECAAAGATC